MPRLHCDDRRLLAFFLPQLRGAGWPSSARTEFEARQCGSSIGTRLPSPEQGQLARPLIRSVLLSDVLTTGRLDMLDFPNLNPTRFSITGCLAIELDGFFCMPRRFQINRTIDTLPEPGAATFGLAALAALARSGPRPACFGRGFAVATRPLGRRLRGRSRRGRHQIGRSNR